MLFKIILLENDLDFSIYVSVYMEKIHKPENEVLLVHSSELRTAVYPGKPRAHRNYSVISVTREYGFSLDKPDRVHLGFRRAMVAGVL